MSSDVDVIIIGAGAAGLSAAKEADQRSLSFTLLEASNRIGGRAYRADFKPSIGPLAASGPSSGTDVPARSTVGEAWKERVDQARRAVGELTR